MKEYDKPILIVKSHIKDFFNEKGYWIKPQSFRDINDLVILELDKIIKRCEKSKMKTISPKHI